MSELFILKFERRHIDIYNSQCCLKTTQVDIGWNWHFPFISICASGLVVD